MTRALPLVGLFALLVTACKKDGGTPAYVMFEPPVVTDAAGKTVSSKITDLWVFVDDQPVGVWQPERRIPVLAAGAVNIKMVAGVRRNGLVNDRIQYPFYATWQQNADLVPGQPTILAPQVHYFDNLDQWLADFDTGQRFDTSNCTATMSLVPTDSTLIGQGTHFGRVVLDTGHNIYRGVSSGDEFTGVGAKTFLEMDYRSDTRIQVGVRYKREGVQYEVAYLYLRPSSAVNGILDWNKVYIDLAEPWNVSGAVEKRFFFKAELEDGATTGVIDVDNIKLVRP